MKKFEFTLSDKAIEELLDIEIEAGIFTGDREKELQKRLNNKDVHNGVFG